MLDVVRPGEKVLPVRQFGLAPIVEPQYVVRVHPDGVEISPSPGGPPRTDLQDQPRHYPLQGFRKVS